MLRSLVVLTVWVLAGVPAGLVGFCWTFLTRDATALNRWGVAIAAFGLRLVGVRADAVFAAPLSAGSPVLFLVNHASNLDPPLVAHVLPMRTSMLIKRELLQIPLLGWAFRLAGYVPVARTGSVEDAKHSLRQAEAMIRSGVSLVIFVEGTRSRDGRLLPFKKGPFFLAESCGVPVVPVTIAGTSKLLPKGSFRLQPGRVQITVHAPLDPKAFADRTQLSAAVRSAISSALPPAPSDE